MTYKIGIYGSGVDESKPVMKKAQALGKLLGQKQCIVITGACSGVPYQAARAAHQQGAKVWGFSPACSLEKQKELFPEQDLNVYSKLIYVPKDFSFSADINACKKYRNLTSTATCDGALIINGRWGTLNEFTNLIGMNKVTVVLTGTGGIADELLGLTRKINKNTKAVVIFDNSPENLIEKIFAELEKINL